MVNCRLGCVYLLQQKGNGFFWSWKSQKGSFLSEKYFVTVATLNVTLDQWQIYGDIFQQRWLTHVLPVKYWFSCTLRVSGGKKILYVKPDL